MPVPKNKIVHLTATAPGQHFISWTVKVNGVEQDPTFLKPDADDPTKVTFIMPDANVEVTATFADDPIGPDGPDPVGPSDTGNIQARSLLWSWVLPQVLLSMKPAPASTASSICPASPCPPTVSSWPSCCGSTPASLSL